MRRGRSTATCLALAVLALSGRVLFADPLRYEFSEPHMGTLVRIVVYASDPGSAARAASAAFARVASLDAAFSDYRDDSELMALCRRAGEGPVPVSLDTFELLTRAAEISHRAGGAFDVTVGPAVQLWRRARRTRSLPDPERIAAARALVGHEHVRLDEASRTVRLAKSGMRLDLGGIAKGYAAQEATRVLTEAGIARSLVAAGGDIVVTAPPPGARGWTVAVAPVEAASGVAPLSLRDAAVSTSGGAEQFAEIGGVRYAHIVDPRTARAIEGSRQVTVVARDGATADGLATATVVLGEEGLAVVDATPGAAAILFIESPGGVRRLESRNWAALTSTGAVP